MLCHLDKLLKESADWKNLHIDMVSLHEEGEPTDKTYIDQEFAITMRD